MGTAPNQPKRQTPTSPAAIPSQTPTAYHAARRRSFLGTEFMRLHYTRMAGMRQRLAARWGRRKDRPVHDVFMGAVFVECGVALARGPA